jgi:hypothetical protein
VYQVCTIHQHNTIQVYQVQTVAPLARLVDEMRTP